MSIERGSSASAEVSKMTTAEVVSFYDEYLESGERIDGESARAYEQANGAIARAYTLTAVAEGVIGAGMIALGVRESGKKKKGALIALGSLTLLRSASYTIKALERHDLQEYLEAADTYSKSGLEAHRADNYM